MNFMEAVKFMITGGKVIRAKGDHYKMGKFCDDGKDTLESVTIEDVMSTWEVFTEDDEKLYKKIN